jgi:hypothetical protein
MMCELWCVCVVSVECWEAGGKEVGLSTLYPAVS